MKSPTQGLGRRIRVIHRKGSSVLADRLNSTWSPPASLRCAVLGIRYHCLPFASSLLPFPFVGGCRLPPMFFSTVHLVRWNSWVTVLHSCPRQTYPVASVFSITHFKAPVSARAHSSPRQTPFRRLQKADNATLLAPQPNSATPPSSDVQYNPCSVELQFTHCSSAFESQADTLAVWTLSCHFKPPATRPWQPSAAPGWRRPRCSPRACTPPRPVA